MEEIEVNGMTFRIGKLDAFKQFNVSRKVAPMLSRIVPVLMGMSKTDALQSGEMDRIAPLFQPFADALAEMPDDAAKYVFDTCLGVVSRKVGNSFHAVITGGEVMYMDMNQSHIIPLIVHVIRGNLGNFMDALAIGPSTQSPAP